MRTRVVFATAVTVLLICLGVTAGSFADLSGWWKVMEDNYHMIKIEQTGSDIALYGTDQPVLYGIFVNDTMWIYITDPAPDTLFFAYTNDTLSGINEEGHPITLVRYVVDLTGWWRNTVAGGVDYLKMLQQGSDVTIWGGDDSSIMVNGAFANDSLLIFLLPPVMPNPDTMFLVYAFDTLRGVDFEGGSMVMARMPHGLWESIHCGTITLDGNTSDWSEEFLVADDPDNDAANGNPSSDYDNLYLCHDSAYLYMRFDCVGDVVLMGDRYTILLGRNIHGQLDYEVRFDYGNVALFRNGVTGQETSIDPPAIMGIPWSAACPCICLNTSTAAWFMPQRHIGITSGRIRSNGCLGET